MYFVPLYRIAAEDRIKRLEEIEKDPSKLDLDELSAWREYDNWETKREQFWRSIHEKANALRTIVGMDSAVRALADITLNYGDISAFKAALESYLFERLRVKGNIKDALALLFYKSSPEEVDSDCGPNISAILDLAEYSRFSYPVASEETTRGVNAALLAAKTAKPGGAVAFAVETDAFGTAYSEVGEPMPEVKLAGGFSVKLRAMFRAQKSQYKYGRIDNGSFPIAGDNRAKLKSALEYVAADTQKNIFWKNADKDEIVFAYPSPFTEVDLGAMQVLGGGGVQEKVFEAAAKTFIKTLSGLPPEQKPEDMHVFSIRKMDKSRSKVVYSRSRTVDGFVGAAEAWQDGCENVPELPFDGIVPYPLDVPKTMNKIWKQDGTVANGKKAVKCMQFYQGLELLLDRQDENELRHWAHALVRGVTGFVQYAANKGFALADALKKEAAEICAVLGLLLYKRGIKKECYMESTAYLIGQLLKVSDELHVLYCKAVRKGDVPPQLAGNAVFNTAADNPIQTLAMLCTRMIPYLAWAKQYSQKKVNDREEDEKERKLTGWHIAQYSRIADKLGATLDEKGKTIRFDDFDKAQLFIGYLASFPKKSTDGGANDENPEKKQEVSGDGN
ncbi:MAG: hypothetical protein LBB66_08600, partial [Desulfovibrio sp.]|jgi:hypothetical protein|nr:hypothetical protein [Desulfovibrio sp.]